MSFNLMKDVPIINNRKELKEWLKPLYIISDYLNSHDDYNIFITKLGNIVKGCFVIRECREFPIKFKFYKNDSETYELELRHFYVNMILWYPFIELNDLEVLDKSFILDCYNDIPRINDYINNHLITILREYHVKNTFVNYSISEVLYNLRKISQDFSLILGLNFDAQTFINMYEENSEFREMMEYQFPDGMAPHDIEVKLDEFEKRTIDIFKSSPNNGIGVILTAKTGIKLKQLREFTISEGLKPTLTGETLPMPIQNSTVYKGLTKPSDLYTDATGARKSLVTNKKVMGRAGYFGKMVLLLARTLSISTDISDCGTSHLVTYDVKNEKILNKLNGKYFKETESDYLSLLDSSKCKHLIGKKILVRSPATCACRDSNKVCPRCVGLTAVINQDISDGFAAFESEEVTKVVNQSILSTKHLLTTNSEVVEFNSDFHKFFTIVCGEINPIVNYNPFVDDINDYAIYIDPNDLSKVEEMDDDSLYNTVIENGKFYIKNIEDSSEEDIPIYTLNEKEIFVSREALDLMKKNKGLIKFKDLDDNIKLFEVVIMNQELTKPLYDLMDLINKNKCDGINETIDSMSQRFLELLIESGISANNVAAEIIINRLIRSEEDIYSRPDFSQRKMPRYSILTVRKALEMNESPLISLSFQNIKKLFLSDDVYDKRTGTSYIDAFFKPEISTDHLKEYSKLMSDKY